MQEGAHILGHNQILHVPYGFGSILSTFIQKTASFELLFIRWQHDVRNSRPMQDVKHFMSVEVLL